MSKGRECPNWFDGVGSGDKNLGVFILSDKDFMALPGVSRGGTPNNGGRHPKLSEAGCDN